MAVAEQVRVYNVKRHDRGNSRFVCDMVAEYRHRGVDVEVVRPLRKQRRSETTTGYKIYLQHQIQEVLRELELKLKVRGIDVRTIRVDSSGSPADSQDPSRQDAERVAAVRPLRPEEGRRGDVHDCLAAIGQEGRAQAADEAFRERAARGGTFPREVSADTGSKQLKGDT